MKSFIRTALLTLLALHSAVLTAQTPPFATGLKAPIELAFTRNGQLIVVEAGNGPNTGRISLVNRATGTRRTFIDALPSGFHQVTPPAPAGPTSVALSGATLYLTIGNGDSVQPGPLPGTEVPNAQLSSPIFSSLLALRPSVPLDVTAGGFLLEPSHHARIKNGEVLTLTNSAGEELEIRLVVDFPNFTNEPRPDFPENVRLSNIFGVAALGQTLFVVDASQNLIYRVDANSGAYTTLTTFAKVQNPTPVGPPMIDAVPNSVRLRGDKLLVTLLTGFPFPSGQAEVRTVDINSGVNERLVGGLTSALDVIPLGSSPASQMVVAEFSIAQMQGQPGRVRLVAPNAAPVTLAEGQITPTGLAVDQQSGEIFVSHLGPGIISRIQAASLIPAAPPRAIIPAVASTNGAFGSRYRTSLQISNPYPFAISGRIVVHPAGVQGSPSDPSFAYSLAPFETKSYNDLVVAAGTSGLGTADVITSAGDAPSLVVQVFDEASTASASVLMPVVEPSAALTAGTRGSLITPADASQTRFNIGIRTLESGATMTITVHDTAGAPLRSRAVAYPSNYFIQVPLAALTEGPLASNQSVVFAIESGSAIVYGSSADNAGMGMTVQVATPAME